jgi:hypothetical protein
MYGAWSGVGMRTCERSPTTNTIVGVARLNPSDFPRAVAQTGSMHPETTRTIQAM